jgi:CheY-like chemotaxis protein
VCRVLEDAEFTIDVTNSGQDALTQMVRDRPDPVVLDIIMPAIIGLRFVAASALILFWRAFPFYS